MRNHHIMLLSALLAACASDPAPASTTEAHTETGNTDVQVVSAADLGPMFFELDDRFDRFRCAFSELEDYSGSPPITHLARADCSAMLEESLGSPLFNPYVEPRAAIEMHQEGEVTYAYFAHTCNELSVTIAVKQRAYESESFLGIGFYAHDVVLNDREELRHVFVPKDDLVAFGEASLVHEDHEPVLLFHLSGAGNCLYNGSGSVPWGEYVELKPYAAYDTADGIVERWESVPDNHRIHYGGWWDRSGDLFGW